ncbi:MAG: hypothetical protein FJ349_06095 [Sphingomonadales bacterium]|nr:hypothetical protein [Sphingomonadales bacterium]
MKRIKEVLIGLFVILVLYASYALLPFLNFQKTQTAQIPVFKGQVLQIALIPLQVVQSWVLEQQLESKDPAVQETLKRFAQQFKSKPDKILSTFELNLKGAVAYYFVDQPGQQLSFFFIPGTSAQRGWLSDTYFSIDQGLFIFTNSLSLDEKTAFTKTCQNLQFKKQTFEARAHHFELRNQTYTLRWEEHAFELELPMGIQDAKTILNPKGFHVSCPIAFSNLPAKYRFFENINACSVNYYGAKLNTKQALALEFEALLSFNRPTQIKDFLHEAKKVFPDWNWQNNFVRVNDAVYALKPEGRKQLYICSSPKKHIQNGAIAKQESASPVVISGDPTLLTKLDNAGWAAAILELFPIYRGLSDFSARTAKVSTQRRHIRWKLKKDYFAAGEFLKLLGTASE